MNAGPLSGPPPTATAVALVAAKDRADSVGATVRALLATGVIERVVVIDDGSDDDTAAQAGAAGADVVRLEVNRGKGDAIRAGIAAAPQAARYLLVDADLGVTAASTVTLLDAVVGGRAEMAIGVPTTAAGRRGGLGGVRRLAQIGIRKATGFEAVAPLSGQRAVDGPFLRSLVEEHGLAHRFGLETALTIDAIRSHGRVVEVPIDFEHRHTGRTLSGFAHRAGQGRDIVRALWARLTSVALRRGLIVGTALFTVLFGALNGPRSEPDSVPGPSGADRVVLFGYSRLSLSDLGNGSAPVLDRLRSQGAWAASSVRTRSARPATIEGYATLGAGDRIRARDVAADTFAVEDPIGAGTAADAAELRTGVAPTGEVVVVGAAATTRLNDSTFLSSTPGALGDALHAAGKTTAVVNNSDVGNVATDTRVSPARPAAASVMDRNGSVDYGVVSHDLLETAPREPFGVTVDEDRFVQEALRLIGLADVTVLDPGELDRTAAFRAETTEENYEALRLKALARTDRLLGRIVASLPSRTLLVVAGIRPPTAEWELSPLVLWGHGVRPGYAHSPSTKRLGLVTITDLAPTVLTALDVETPAPLIGHALRLRPGSTSLSRLQAMNDLAAYRERLYLPLTKGYVVFQAILYLLTIILFSARGGVGRARPALRWAMLAIAGLPLATFLFRMVPHAWALGPFGIPAILAIDFLIAWLALRYGRHHPLSALSWLLFGTVAIMVVDVCTGARLQQSSVLGYSPHTAARFTGIGNAAFAALTATTVLWAAIHVAYSRRRREAWLGAAGVCAVVAFVDGAPVLGSDVGGILTLVPVFGLLLYAMAGRRISVRALATAGCATLLLVAVATGVDLLRPAEKRSHLGRFVSATEGENSTFSTTIGRKLTTNLRVLSGSFWRWVVPIIVIVLLYFLIVQRGWERDMPAGSALRTGVIGALVAGMLGFAVNDSGTVVAAIVFVYIGPYITLLALAREPPPHLIPVHQPSRLLLASDGP